MRPTALATVLCLCPPGGLAQDAALISAAKTTLEIAQKQSIKKGLEYCGLLGQIAGARMVSTKPTRGGADRCKPAEFSGDVTVMASYHTHGSYDPYSDSEVPSVDDVLADIEEGVFGFVATPGGRLWMIDPQSAVAMQLCGIGCLTSDPEFEPGPADTVRARYTLGELYERQAAHHGTRPAVRHHCLRGPEGSVRSRDCLSPTE